MTPLSNRGIDDELTGMLKKAQEGDQVAWEKLFHEYYPKVIRVVRRKLGHRRGLSMRSVFDSTDFASDVMKSLAANLNHMEFPSSAHLVAFLAQVAEKKVINEYRRIHSLKRDVTRERPIEAASESFRVQLASDAPTASQLAQAKEAVENLLNQPDETSRQVVALRAEGHDNHGIAAQTGWNIRKVQRFFQKLQNSMHREGP